MTMRAMVLAGAMLALAGCGDEEPEVRINSLADMKGRPFGCLSGSAFRELTEAIQPGIDYRSYNDQPSAMVALKKGKIDGVSMDEPVARFWVSHNPGVYRIAQIYTTDHYAFAFKKGAPLAKEFSAVIKRLKAGGDLERYVSKWCELTRDDVAFEPLPDEPGHTGSRGTIKMAVSPELEPVTYAAAGGRIVGFEPEIARRIAWEMDMRVEFVPLSFGALIESVVSGKADLAGCAIIVTPEREKSMDFSMPHHTGGVTLVVRGDNAGAQGSLARRLARSFRRTFVEEHRWRDILDGLGQTLLITAFSVLLGTVLAFPVWLLRTSRNRFARGFGDAFVAVMQGTPILVVLMILYYVVFGECDISAPAVAVVGFALNFAAYAGEMLRTGVASVPDGQREAALAIGFTPFGAFVRVVFPQALRNVLPVYRGEVIGLLKATSIVGYISVIDLTKVSDLIRARTYEAFFPLVSTAVIYFFFAMLITRALERVERRLDPASRRKEVAK